MTDQGITHRAIRALKRWYVSSIRGPEAFIRAAAKGDIATMREFLAWGYDINTRWEAYTPPLRWDSPAPRFTTGSPDEFYHPLHVAAEHGVCSSISFLLEQPGIDVNARWGDRTAVTLAADERHHDALRLLLADPRCNRDHAEADGNTALHWAIRNGNTEGCRILLLGGANPFLRNKDGCFPHDCLGSGNGYDGFEEIFREFGIHHRLCQLRRLRLASLIKKGPSL